MEEAVAAAAAASAAFFALLASSALCCASSSRSLCDGSDSTLLPPLVKVRVWGLKKVAGLAWDLFFSSLGFSGSIFGPRGRKAGRALPLSGFFFLFPLLSLWRLSLSLCLSPAWASSLAGWDRRRRRRRATGPFSFSLFLVLGLAKEG